jgi:predicted Zn-dependent protease
VNSKALSSLLISFLLLLALTAGCVGPGVGGPALNVFSVQQEIEMGQKFSQEIDKKAEIVKDPLVARYISGLGARLVPADAARIYPFTFSVIKDKAVNAFAVPGGPVYVHSGLIKKASSEAELASVVAHEIGHVVNRHGSQQMSAQVGYSFLASLLLGQNPAGWQQLTAKLMGTSGLLAYGRSHENQADVFAVGNLYRSGYDVYAMVTFFYKLKALEKSEPGAIAKFFSSHPPTSERLARIQALISTYPRQRDPITTSGAFLRVQAALN